VLDGKEIATLDLFAQLRHQTRAALGEFPKFFVKIEPRSLLKKPGF
jgi:hypothetical protein